MSNEQVQTISVPYIPKIGESGVPAPKYFTDRIKDNPVFDDFELTQIWGTKMVFFDGEWMDHGHYAVFTRIKDTAALPPQPQPNLAEGTDASDNL